MPITALLFDFGGVFTDSPFSVVHDYGAELGLAPGEISDIVFGSYEVDGDHPWHRLERGEIPLEEARASILALGGERGHPIDIYDLFGRMAANGAGAGQRAPLVARVRELRAAGLPIALVTNNVAEFGDGWRALVPVDELFDVVIASSAVGLRKPDPRIFELALDRLGNVAPEQALFLDDYPANIAAAERLGMRGLTVTADIGAALRALDEALHNG